MKYKDEISLELETISNRLQTMRSGVQNRAYTQRVLSREIFHVGGNVKKILSVITEAKDVYYKERIEKNLTLIVAKIKQLYEASENNSKNADEFISDIESVMRLVEFVSDTVNLENRELT